MSLRCTYIPSLVTLLCSGVFPWLVLACWIHVLPFFLSSIYTPFWTSCLHLDLSCRRLDKALDKEENTSDEGAGGTILLAGTKTYSSHQSNFLSSCKVSLSFLAIGPWLFSISQ